METTMTATRTVPLYLAARTLDPIGYGVGASEHDEYLFMAVRFQSPSAGPELMALAERFAALDGVMSCTASSGTSADPRQREYHSVLDFHIAKSAVDPTGLDMAMSLLGIIGPRYKYNAVFEQHLPGAVTIILFMLGTVDEPDGTLPLVRFDIEALSLVAGVRQIEPVGNGQTGLRVMALPGFDPAEVATNVAKLAGIKPGSVARFF